jgi:hypothetical protein
MFQPSVFLLFSIALFMIFISFNEGSSHLSLTILLVTMLFSLNYRETQAPKRRDRMESQAQHIRKECDTKWMKSVLEPFKKSPSDEFKVSYENEAAARMDQLYPIRRRIIAKAQGIVSNFPYVEIVEKCAAKINEEENIDQRYSPYVMCVLENIWASNHPEWVYDHLLQQYGTAPLMLSVLALSAYFTPGDETTNSKNQIPAPVDFLFVNEKDEIRINTDYSRIFIGANLESVQRYSDGASRNQIENLLGRLKSQAAITIPELRWILTAEYAGRFHNRDRSLVWKMSPPPSK